MSGAAFEGLEGLDLGAPGSDYTKGEVACDLSLVDEVVQYYIDDSTHRILGLLMDRGKGVLHLMPLLERGIGEGFHPNAFLDCLIVRLGERWEELKDDTFNLWAYDSIGAFLDIVVQGLYCKDYNRFVLDLGPLASYFARVHEAPDGKKKGKDLACGLIASEDRPLVLKVIGNIGEFGRWSRNCALELDGNADSAGETGRHTRYILHGAVEEIAEKSEGCRFDIEQPARIGEGAKETEIYARNGVSKEGRSAWKFVGEKSNSLYVPLADGAWGKVGPEGEVMGR